MVIPRIFYRHFGIASFHARRKFPENGTQKRLFLKNIENVAVKNGRNCSVYESDGKTFADVINWKNAETFCIHQYMKEGFILPNGSELTGSLIIFPHAIISWNVSEAKNVTEESLVLFKLLEPKIDILIFGYGSRNEYTPEVRENFTKCCKNLGLRFEALPTSQAVGTYNFLSEERRLVAGALIPPKFIDMFRFDRSRPAFYLEDEDEDSEDFKTIPEPVLDKKLIK